MKVAVLSDIHGNIYALEAVLKRAVKEDVDRLLILGDIVGYYYDPDKVLRILSEWQYDIIGGNHERILQQLLQGQVAEMEIARAYGSGHRMALNKLTEEQIDTLISAPEKMEIEIDGTKFLMNHGSPWDPDAYLYPDSELKLLKKCDFPNVDFVLIGHSHHPFVFQNKNSMLVNVGSVGQARNIGGVAFWGLIQTHNRALELKATPYDTAVLREEVKRIDPEVPNLETILTRNRHD